MIMPVRAVLIRVGLPAAVWLLVSGQSAQAHHSVAPFDRSNPIAVTGTIKQFIWANPHSWIYLQVPNDKGGFDEWDLEGSAVNGMARAGWKPDTLKPGMQVRLKVSPRRDGKIGGEYTEVLQVDGKPFALSR